MKSLFRSHLAAAGDITLDEAEKLLAASSLKQLLESMAKDSNWQCFLEIVPGRDVFCAFQECVLKHQEMYWVNMLSFSGWKVS